MQVQLIICIRYAICKRFKIGLLCFALWLGTFTVILLFAKMHLMRSKELIFGCMRAFAQ